MSIFWILLIAAGVVILCTILGNLIASDIQKKGNSETPVNTPTPENKETPAVSTSEENASFSEKEGEYSGILHVSNGRYRFERPVMFKIYRGEKMFFEYDENTGKKIPIHNELRNNILRMLEDDTFKCRSLKRYPLTKNS